MLKIGLILPDLSSSQLTFLAVEQLNRILHQSGAIDGVIFVENISKPAIPPACAIMDLSEIWNFDGLLISTTLDNTNIMIKSVIPAQKVFYVWDMEWLRGTRKNDFKRNVDILRDPTIKLVVRSESHAKCLANYANREADLIVDNFDIGRVINEFQQRK